MSKSIPRPAARPGKLGEVVFLSEKMNEARELSSCCVGTEAMLETGGALENIISRGRHGGKTDDPKQS